MSTQVSAPTGRAYVDGVVTDLDQARIPVTDRGLRYGEGVFEVLRTVAGRPLLLERHLARLGHGCLAIGLPAPDLARLRAAVDATLDGFVGEARLRVTITGGDGAALAAPARARLLVVAEPLRPAVDPDAGVVLVSSDRPTLAPASLDPQLKALAYLDRLLAHRGARAVGADDAIRCDVDGLVAECATASLLLVDGARLLIPASRGALPGVTAGLLAELLQAAGVVVVRRPVRPDELTRIDGALITSAVRGVVAVDMIDGRRLTRPPLVAEAIRAHGAYLAAAAAAAGATSG
jgi:branched-chain amino acid aminotransferase